jgi:methylmalonyl-CoA/ethylmalonyl-CoA epimerase
MLKKLLHVGTTGNDFDRMVERFKGFGLECSQVVKNEELGVNLAFMPVGETMLELICHVRPPTGDDPMVNVVTGQKGAINHLCFEVDNLEESIGDFERNGAKLVESCPRQGAHGRVAFFYPETTEGVLIELCELGQDRATS